MRMKRLELVLQQPYGVSEVLILFVLLFVQCPVWSTRGLCLGRHPGAPWPCPGSGKSCGQDEPGLIRRAGVQIPTWSCSWKQALWACSVQVINVFGAAESPAVLCWVLPPGRGWIWGLPGGISCREALSCHRGRLWTPGCGSLTSLDMAPASTESGTNPLSPRAKCVQASVSGGVTEPTASQVLLWLWVWCGLTQKSECGSQNWAPEQAAQQQCRLFGNLMAPAASLLRLWGQIQRGD